MRGAGDAARTFLADCKLVLLVKFETGLHLACTTELAAHTALAAEDKLMLVDDIKPGDVDCPGGKPRLAGIGAASCAGIEVAIGAAHGGTTACEETFTGAIGAINGAVIDVATGAINGAAAGADAFTTPCKRTLPPLMNVGTEPLSGRSRETPILECENLRCTGIGAGTGVLFLQFTEGTCATSLETVDATPKSCEAL
eukprot:CAMPEP_0169186640 /NCGR_PEP_ID=MMETSP1016-20121227/2484_1 /TAXON_ID=342587 /ORGANISM="Karlodinium micrum, Strain CCMP2283" /LENGTH=197 /DNA_ID=CAMNT_0009262517 /DNA_START=634 /DNA_END=1227 /DNA_ORIENTATION=-